MDLIVETDIGHDPDDFFALCYLISCGVNIRAILVSPGDADQIAIAKFLVQEVGLDIPVAADKLNRTKLSSGSVHYDLLRKYGRSLTAGPDGFGASVLEKTIAVYPKAEFFVIGPVTSIGRYFADHPDAEFERATMQGGFLGYDLHNFPCKRLEKFEGHTWQPTFNLNGDRPRGLAFIGAKIKERRFVGKNVCHTVIYDETIHRTIKPKDRASELFKEGMDLYLAKHQNKAFHDPAAAVCHLHPEIGSWVRGKTTKIEGGWGTVLDENGDYILADINYDQLWHHIATFS